MDKEIIIDINNPKNWAKDIKTQLDVSNIKIPSNRKLENLICIDYLLNLKDIEIINFFKPFKVRLYHACRTIDIDSYYKKGLLVPTKDYYHNLFELYIKELNLEISEEKIRSGHDYIQKHKSENKIFFALMPNLLLGHAGHYLSYGSELILAAFCNIYGDLAHYLIKDKFGQATMIKVDIPISNLSDYRQQVICFDALSCINAFLRNKEYYTNSDCWYDKNIPPSLISSHYFPEEFYCPHTHQTIKV